MRNYYRSITMLIFGIVLGTIWLLDLIPLKPYENDLMQLTVLTFIGAAAVFGVLEYCLACSKQLDLMYRRDRALKYMRHEHITGKDPIGPFC